MVKISKMNVLWEDDRGTTLEFNIPRKQSEFILITRKKNTTSGNVYHTGATPATSPKILVLLSGKIVFSYRNIDSAICNKEEIIAPAIIEISPYIVHNVYALEDFTMLEYNSKVDLECDKVKQEV